MKHWQPESGMGHSHTQRLQAGRRISLVGWGLGLAMSLGLWAAAYYLLF